MKSMTVKKQILSRVGVGEESFSIKSKRPQLLPGLFADRESPVPRLSIRLRSVPPGFVTPRFWPSMEGNIVDTLVGLIAQSEE